MKQMKVFRISSFEISFLDSKTGQVEETHKTTFKITPTCSQATNLRETIADKVYQAIDGDRRKHILRINTNRGRFYSVYK